MSRKTESWPIRVSPGKPSRTASGTRPTVWEPLTQRTSHKVPNVNNLMHRRTRRGIGEGGRPPWLENFQSKLCFSGQAQVAQKPAR